VLTNNHVIDGATSIKARDVGNGHTYTAKVVGYDKTHDVAVLQLQGASGLQTVTLSSAGAQVGQKVVALGNALGKGGTPSVATGKVTGLNRSITASDEGAGDAEQLSGMIGHNAGIQPGDSGGPLVNTYGEVIGMDTAASPSGGQQTAPATQAFAIPITKASSIASEMESGTPTSSSHLGATAFLGIESSPSSTGGSLGGNGGFGPGSNGGFGPGSNGGFGPGSNGGFGGFGGGITIGPGGITINPGGNGNGAGGFGGGNGNGAGGFGGSAGGSTGGSASGSGVTISGVVSGSPAAGAGLTAGDQITSVAGHSVTSTSQIASVLRGYHPGDKISISWTDQSGQSHTATVVLVNGPAA
jgi:S1-C subfamily serine protease